jgi:hypothetical protein
VRHDGLLEDNKWVRLLAYVTGLINQELITRHSNSRHGNGLCIGGVPYLNPLGRRVNTYTVEGREIRGV